MCSNEKSLFISAVSHIPQFGDATTSSAGDAASPMGDVDVSAGDAHLQISGYATLLIPIERGYSYHIEMIIQ
jgi:hypothetical protein